MSDLSLQLEGMELLAVQYLLDGKNSAYGYKFELLGLDKADFSGSRDEQMLDTRLVQEAEKAGDLRKVKFYVTHEDKPARTRAIQLNFYEDGHVTSTSEVRPGEFDDIVHAISDAKEYSNYLTSLNDLIGKFIQDTELESKRGVRKNRINRGFDRYLQSKLNIQNSDVIENHMYKMVIANIGVKLYQIAKDKEFNTEEHSMDSWNEHVRDFFESYAQYELEGVGEEEYMIVASMVDRLVDNWNNREDTQGSLHGAMGLLEEFVDTHDL